MKPFYALALLLLLSARLRAQQFCNPNGNLVLYSNYDGGTLNIVVDQDIPNLYIGITSYEAVAISITGAYAANVMGVTYAGYNSMNNNNCSPTVGTTSITWAFGTTTNTNLFVSPNATLSNTYGWPQIICAYSCETATSQGGCNTPDQIAAYFLAQFPGTTLRYHQTQYGCWSGAWNVSAGGNCCATGGGSQPLSASANATPLSCSGDCTATVSVNASGGTFPYNYQWTGGPATASWSNRCAGSYYVTVTDAAGATYLDTVVVAGLPALGSSTAVTACGSYAFGGNVLTASGMYEDTMTSMAGCDSIVALDLTIPQINTDVMQSGAMLTAQAAAPATYQWVMCSGGAYTTIAGAMAQTYTATANGNYGVIVTLGGCSDTSVCKTVTGLSMDAQTLAGNSVRIFPNPVRIDGFSIQAPAAMTGAQWTLTDGLGRAVAQGRLAGAQTPVSGIRLAAGIYHLRVAGLNGAVKLVR